MSKFTLALNALLLVAAVEAKPAVIAHKGRSGYVLVTPDAKSPAVDYAAKELQSFLRQMAGVELAVVAEKDAGRKPAFLLGPCRRSAKAGLVLQARQLPADGVLIRSIGKDIALLGSNERGDLYSVYVLLEKFLGVRFIAWDCIVVPRQADVSLPELDYRHAPPFMYRETLYFDSFPREIAARQRLNGPTTKCDASTGGKIDFFPYVHSFDDLFPEKVYFKDHPEYYGLQGGKRVAGVVHAQICLSNPDVLRIAKQTVLKWIEEHPDVPIIDVSQNDDDRHIRVLLDPLQHRLLRNAQDVGEVDRGAPGCADHRRVAERRQRAVRVHELHGHRERGRLAARADPALRECHCR
jgi:hypothetical protein